jgi:hypothetical protein
MTRGGYELVAPKTKLEQEVEEFLALPKEERQRIAHDIVKKLVKAKRKKTPM